MFDYSFEIPKKGLRDKESYRYKLVQAIGHSLMLEGFRIHGGHYRVVIRRLTKAEVAEYEKKGDAQ